MASDIGPYNATGTSKPAWKALEISTFGVVVLDHDGLGAPLGDREVRDIEPYREKRNSSLSSFNNGKYSHCHCHQSGFL